MPRPLTIFVYEYLTGGACAELPLESSLMREGRAMADTIITDFVALADTQVVTLRDRRLPVDHPEVAAHFVDDPAGELSQFQRLCAVADRLLVIAPETDGILTQRVEQARQVNPWGVLNCGPEALRLGSDKWELDQRLQDWNIPTIPTELCAGKHSVFEPPVVIKPRDGAGCEGVRVIRDKLEFTDANQNLIVQPLLGGVALSSAACFSESGKRLLTLPVGKQFLEIGTSIRYSGGMIPWQHAGQREAERQAEAIWLRLEQNLSGLAGYVGIDWLWEETTQTLRLVELNPRLTTAYVGYRELAETQIADALLGRKADPGSLCREAVRFSADGTCESVARQGALP